MRITFGEPIMRNLYRTVVFFSVVAAMFAVGCPAVPEVVSPARQACRDLNFGDDITDGLFVAARAGRDGDVDRADALVAVVAECEDLCDESAICIVRCNECSAGVVDHVYD